jgi:hypothetical protein
MMAKYVVPDGMLKAVHAKFRTGQFAIEMHELDAILEAALCWLAENPIVPSEKQERALDDAWMESKRSLTTPYHKFAHASAFGAVEWQRCMFLAPTESDPYESLCREMLKNAPPEVDCVEVYSGGNLLRSVRIVRNIGNPEVH